MSKIWITYWIIIALLLVGAFVLNLLKGYSIKEAIVDAVPEMMYWGFKVTGVAVALHFLL